MTMDSLLTYITCVTFLDCVFLCFLKYSYPIPCQPQELQYFLCSFLPPSKSVSCVCMFARPRLIPFSLPRHIFLVLSIYTAQSETVS